MTYQTSEDDALTSYFVTRVLPFVSKYRWMLIFIGLAVVLTFVLLGFHSWYTAGRDNAIRDDIYGTLKKKQITARVLSDLNEKYKNHEASFEVKWRLASKYTEEKKLSEAAQVYREILEQFPDSPMAVSARLNLAVCLEEAGKHDEAFKLYDDGLHAYADRPGVQVHLLYHKATALYHAKKYAEAEKELAEAERLLAILKAQPRDAEGMGQPDRQIEDKMDFLRNMVTAAKK